MEHFYEGLHEQIKDNMESHGITCGDKSCEAILKLAPMLKHPEWIGDGKVIEAVGGVLKSAIGEHNPTLDNADSTDKFIIESVESHFKNKPN